MLRAYRLTRASAALRVKNVTVTGKPRKTPTGARVRLKSICWQGGGGGGHRTACEQDPRSSRGFWGKPEEGVQEEHSRQRGQVQAEEQLGAGKQLTAAPTLSHSYQGLSRSRLQFSAAWKKNDPLKTSKPAAL